ncbi:synaptotagmin-15-like [Athalia rosae]|uniref:synaptotagmin-15-like n=1 Tax=Athalia rosae TaxID=37344 RepID=UPI0020340603|nr:synaptotagmin-15-like [Athalia rosae]XP_048510535.1 synaptotagmin-15-like [Athalia rosae]
MKLYNIDGRLRARENATQNTKTEAFGPVGSILYPSIGAAAAILLLAIVGTVFGLRRRQKQLSPGPSSCEGIVVYPSQGPAPTFVTKDVVFNLPILRSANSTGDIFSDLDPEDLPMSMERLQPRAIRSNSFGSYGLGGSLGYLEPDLYRTMPSEDPYPEGHIGRIWVKLSHESEAEQVTVTLLKARNLPSRPGGSCDPIVRLHLTPGDRRHVQSRQKRRECNPKFDETFVLQVPNGDLTGKTLRISVIDGGRPKRNSTIGYAALALDGLLPDGEPRIFQLDLDKEPPDHSARGEVLLSLQYNDHSGRLTLTVMEAKGLRQGVVEVCARATLSKHCKPLKTRRTALARPRQGTWPFSEALHFRLSGPDASLTGSLAVSLLARGTKERALGRVVLGPYMFARGPALEHWTAAFSRPREPTQRWHTLS